MDYVQDLPLLKELIASFPYFPASYLLMTKLLYQEKSIYTEKYIKLTASYIGDREILYNYLYSQEKKEESISVPEIIEPAAMPVVEIPEITATPLYVSEAIPEAPEIIEAPVPLEIPETTEISAAPVPIPEPVAEPEIQEIEEAPVEVISETPEIIPEAAKPIVPIEADFDYFASYYPNAKVKTEEKIEKTPIIPPSIPIEKIIDIKPAPEKPAPTPSNNSFGDWLSYLNNNPAPAKKLEALPEFENIENHPKISKDEMHNIIDKFITSEPRMKRETGRAKFYNPEDMANNSVREDTELVTETLAKIYEKQELWAKAKDMYEKLSLKIPEKSLYFAEKIRELKNKP